MKLDNNTLTALAMLLRGVVTRSRNTHYPTCYSSSSMAIYEHQKRGISETSLEKGYADGTIA